MAVSVVLITTAPAEPPGVLPPVVKNAAPLAPPRTDSTTTNQGVVVLVSGRVFSGTVTEIAGGYRVEQETGHVTLPYNQVKLTARSLAAAYEALRRSFEDPTAREHLALADWCLEHGLLRQAHAEVNRALILEPLRTDARTMLIKLEAQLNPHKKGATVSRPAMSADGFVHTGESTASGLSRGTLQTYIRHVQPLLMNKCGNAHCHGAAATNAFHIQNVRLNSQRGRTAGANNLDTVLNFIDPENPSASDLIAVIREGSEPHAKIFSGPKGDRQLEILANWVAQVSDEFDPSKVGRPRPNRFTPPSTAMRLANANAPVNGSSADALGRVVFTKSEMRTSPQQTADRSVPRPFQPVPDARPLPNPNISREARLLERIRQEEAPDLFDPDEFNRKVHGMTARQLRNRSSND